MKKKWIAVAAGLVVTFGSVHYIVDSTPITSEKVQINPVRLERALSEDEVDWKTLREDFNKLEALYSEGNGDEALAFWNRLIEQVDIKLGFETSGSDEWTDGEDKKEADIYAQYKVVDGKLEMIDNPLDEEGNPLEIKPVSDLELKRYQIVWEYVMKLMPKSVTQYIDTYEVGSDGRGGDMAFVYLSNETGDKFALNVDLADFTDETGAFSMKDIDETIVHEFGHVLTLNASQMTDVSSGQYETEEGILAEDSYLNQFYNKFWKGKTESYLLSNEDGYREYDTVKLFGDHDSWFVTDYAATNVEEDIAETFRMFVLEDKPTGNKVKDQKINFLYQFPELVQIRAKILANK